MKTFTRPYWIALTVTLPQLLIFLYYIAIYGVVSSLLKPENMQYWTLYGGILGSMGLSASAYAIFLQRRRKPILWPYALLILLGYMAFLLAYLEGFNHLLPADTPRWMIAADEFVLLPLGLMMPALIHALLLLVDRLTPPGNHSLIKAAITAVSVPAFWYLTVRFVFPLLNGRLNWRIYSHLHEVFFILLTVAFMFLLLRLAYLLFLKITPSRAKGIWLVRVPFTLILPLLCLLVYNGKLGGELGELSAELQLIGDWSHPVYYAAVVIIGLLLTLPPPQQKQLRLAKFTAMALAYPFVTYFFIVFLPFFPFAIATVAVFGAGFLLLTPLLLFFVHTWSLHDEWHALGGQYGARLPKILFLAAVALLPVGLTASYAMDRVILDKMLAHVYEPDYTAEEPMELKLASVQRVLGNIKMMKEGADFETGKRKPYLTSYYQWLVLDNLTLSNSRIEMLERIFLGKSSPESQQNVPNVSSSGVTVTDTKTSTVPSNDGSYYISSVDLTITNGEGNNREYAARFHLPPGAWVRDYYLMIDGKRVSGILAERKSALWIYQQIRNTRRDPGIIYYTSPDELILRVFPFAAGEARKTGFEIIHREPLALTLGDKRIELHSSLPLTPIKLQNAAGKNVVLVTPTEKQTLPKIQRSPYLHFIIDRSASAEMSLKRFIECIGQQYEAGQFHGVGLEGAMITLANYESQTFPMDGQWQERVQGLASQGGFFLERAVKQALVANYRQHTNRYPLFVVVTDQIADAITPDGLADFAITMPEGAQFLLLASEGLSVRNFVVPALEAGSQPFTPATRPVLAWPNEQQPRAYLPDDGRASVVINDLDAAMATSEGQADLWQNGLELYGMWLASKLHPHQASQKHQQLIAESFRTHLLSPLTAFLAPENAAQQQMLLKKQEKMLASMRQLDIGEEHEMDEPALWWLLLLWMATGVLRKRAGWRTLWPGRYAANRAVQITP